MTTDLRVALTISLNDQLVGPLRRALDEVEKNLKKVEQELGGVTQKSQQASQAMTALQGPDRAARQVTELARNTQNAVTLAGRLKTAWSEVGNMVRGVTTGVAAFQAAKFVVAQPLQQARSFERQLADAANTAFSDRSVAGRRAGIGELDSIVTNALRVGGGTREQALAALNEMLASGSVSAGQAKGLLPQVAKFATAGGASITDLSNIVVKALQNGFKEADVPRLLDIALAAGQQGGFELKDIAKDLPKLLAAGQLSGLTGFDGFARILASAQGSVITAGSKAEAGNNLLNLLLKINSSDTQRDAKNLGIDLAGSLAQARGKGVNSLDAFVNLVDQIASRDPRVAALRKQAAGAGTDAEKRATFSAQADILQGSAIGKIVQDRQALLSLVAEINKKDFIQGIKGSILGAKGVGDTSFQTIAGTSDFRLEQQANEKLFAQTNVLGGVNDALGTLAETTTGLYQQFPGFAQATEAAKLALTALAAAAGAAGAAQLLTGGGLGKVAAGAAGLLGVGAGASGLALAAGGVGLAGAAGVGAGLLINKGIEGTSAGDALGELVTSAAAFFGSNDAKAALEAMQRYESVQRADSAEVRARLAAVADRPINLNLEIDGQQLFTVVQKRQELAFRRN